MTKKSSARGSASTVTGLGISALPSVQRMLKSIKDAEAIFSMVTEERGTLDELVRLVRHESIMELILLCVDLTKTSRARVNAIKSRQVLIRRRELDEAKIDLWLDKNIPQYTGRLDRCAMDAIQQRVVPKSFSWVRKRITAYMAAKNPNRKFTDS